MEVFETLLRFKRLRRLGHMARMRDEQIPKQLLFGNLCSSSDRGPGRPHKSWQDCVREDRTNTTHASATAQPKLRPKRSITPLFTSQSLIIL